MAPRDPSITCSARLQRPAAPKNASWCFLVLPAEASAKLPTRGMVAVEGRFQGQPLRATLEPDGRASHWLKVPRALRDAAGVAVGDRVSLEFAPSTEVPEPTLPADLRRTLAAAGAEVARQKWAALTPAARRDWIQWITSARKPETRERRLASTCDMLVKGKKRVCCFDRSGIYSKALGAPEAAD